MGASLSKNESGKKVVALLTAAGTGSRMGQDIPKQFLHVDNKPIIIYTMEAFESHPSVDAIVVVTLPAWIEVVKAYALQFNISKLSMVVSGGATGQESIKNGLDSLKNEGYGNETVILVHDGNRCMVSGEIISNSLSTFFEHGCAVAAIPCVEAVFKSENGTSSTVSVPREFLYRTQTPHAYTLGKLLWAHGEAKKRGIVGTAASCTLMQQLGETVYFSKGSEENIKITTKDDLMIFEALLHAKKDYWLK